MRILVTGGAGFVGSAVVDLLVAEGHEVVAADCLHPAAHRGRPDYLNADLPFSKDVCTECARLFPRTRESQPTEAA